MSEEDEPSPEYLKGYNHGYQLAQHEPELLEKLMKAQSGNAPTDYSRAMAQGKNQHQQENLMSEMKAIRERQKQTIRRKRWSSCKMLLIPLYLGLLHCRIFFR